MAESKNRPSKTNRANRPNRVPTGDTHDVMGVHGTSDQYEYRWVNEDKIDARKMNGYEIVEDDDIQIATTSSTKSGSAKTLVTNRKDGSTSTLMRQDKQWYDEDQKSKADKIDRSEETMFRQLKEAEGRYGSIDVE